MMNELNYFCGKSGGLESLDRFLIQKKIINPIRISIFLIDVLKIVAINNKEYRALHFKNRGNQR